MSLMRSLLMVERTEVLQRKTPEDRSVKDRASCKENLYLGREDDIVKIAQMEGGKVHKYMRTHGSEGVTEPGRDGPGSVGPSQSAWPTSGAFDPPFLASEDPSTQSSWRRHHSEDRQPFTPRGHPQARDRGGRSFGKRMAQLEGSTHKWRRRKTLSEASP
jgi:hypothetical protein